MPVSSSTEHWIRPDALKINLNHFGDPDYLQVSLLAGAVVMAFKQDVISYNAAHNYRTWPLQAANTYLETSSAYHVYARLTRSEVNASALVVYDPVLRDIEGREITISENGNETLGESSADYFFVYLGKISGSLDSNGHQIQRYWDIDFRFGTLDTNQYQNEESLGEWSKMFRLSKITDMIEVLKTISSAIFNRIFLKDKVITDVKRSSDADVSDSDEIIPTTKYVKEETERKFLRKDQDDRSKGTIASDKGIEVGQFQAGTLGSGAAIYMQDGSSYGEVDFLKVRKKATFTTLTIQELKHIGGELVLSPAAMVCSAVEELVDGYKCYFSNEDEDGRKIYNEFEVGDQARCQTFGLDVNTYYWRLVTAVGENFIVLSKTDCDTNSDIPKAGDNIVQLGNRTDSDRQHAIILSAYGADAPSYKQYNGINSYSLVGKQVTKLSPFGNELTGKMTLEAGSKGWNNLEGLPDSIQNAVDLAYKAQETIDKTSVGAVNLLRNSGFTGDYQSEDMITANHLGKDTELFSRKLDKWDGDAAVYADTNAVSGYSVQLGALSQSVKELIANESYVVSFKARGSSIVVTCGNFAQKVTITSSYKTYSVKFTFSGSKTFEIEGNARICDLQLERGTISTDWNPSPYDNDKVYAEFQALKYLQDAIVNGSTNILGGLILSSIIKLGNYKNGVMQKVNAGVSGIYNDDNDVAFWGGGTLEQAIKTIIKFKQNPQYRPTDEEWAGLANFVVSHGGDAVFKGSVFADNGIFRGIVYALGGLFKGAVEIANGKIKLNDDGSGHFADGNISWGENGVMYRKSNDVVVWTNASDYVSNSIDFRYGTYIDLTGYVGDEYVLENPNSDEYVITLKYTQPSRSNDCITLSGSFRIVNSTSSLDTTTDASHLKLGKSNKEFVLHYKGGEWYYYGNDAYVDEYGVAILGRSVDNTTEVEADVVNANTYYADGSQGTTTSISFNTDTAHHTLKYKGGILVEYTSDPINNGN